MVFHTFGPATAPTVVLLHGAGLSAWAYQPVAERLSGTYRVVLPVIDGYAEAADVNFVSIEDSARKLIAWIDGEHNGHVLALGGLSLGAQIAVEVLSIRPDIADYAVLESALVCPMPSVSAWAGSLANMSYGLIRRRWFARMQAASMYVPAAMFETYYADSLRLSRDSLANTLASNASYTVKPGLANTSAKTLILVGARELRAMIRSATLLAKTIPHALLWREENMRHGEFSLKEPEAYAQLIEKFLSDNLSASPTE